MALRECDNGVHTTWRDMATAALAVVREAMREPSRDMWTEINAADDKAYAGGSQHGAGFEMLWAVAMAASPLAARKQEAPRDGE